MSRWERERGAGGEVIGRGKEGVKEMGREGGEGGCRGGIGRG